jgi:hypothetical protein
VGAGPCDWDGDVADAGVAEVAEGGGMGVLMLLLLWLLVFVEVVETVTTGGTCGRERAGEGADSWASSTGSGRLVPIDGEEGEREGDNGPSSIMSVLSGWGSFEWANSERSLCGAGIWAGSGDKAGVSSRSVIATREDFEI